MKYRVITTIVLVLIITFIFWNSAHIADESSKQSEIIMNWLNSITTSLGLTFRFTEHITRKLAHFVEFAGLGFWALLTARTYTARVKKSLAWAAIIGGVVPIIDECIQLFVPGRSAQASDVILDFSGVCAGVLVCVVVFGGAGRLKRW